MSVLSQFCPGDKEAGLAQRADKLHIPDDRFSAEADGSKSLQNLIHGALTAQTHDARLAHRSLNWVQPDLNFSTAPAAMNRNIVVIGGSAGALPALKMLLPQLPANLPAAVFITLHMPSESPRLMAEICSKLTSLSVKYAEDGSPIAPGTIHLATPDHHLALDVDRVKVFWGPKENRFRPAIDALFRSAAANHGRGIAAILLSGFLDDGVAGLMAVKACGGITIVQAPDEAVVADLPRNALAQMSPDHVLPSRQIGKLIEGLVTHEVPMNAVTNQERGRAKAEVEMTAHFGAESSEMDKIGSRSDFSCPECGGALWSLPNGRHARYRCHIGHAYTEKALALEMDAVIERGLEIALRSMEESARLAQRMAESLTGEEGPQHTLAERAAKGAKEDADTLRGFLQKRRRAR